ncbi:hypothetical protein CLAVI_000773 [Candidatus Clavichlamydia salmonicola]|uniref:CPBP family intramembrane glutamic endopeptidase n=1 Tax=Candidatus Clavichlamydia salmonicola TaxID=469812 RepID=UPI001891DAE3|nr:CPBP family intramembrane glutamic endopeptidase [Candidatus Clavichlamydia salmonicola]MBF5051137.1 hypothetical protein [Candidatus Clavichlamydia salmonicola]
MYGIETRAFLQIVIILPFAQTALWIAKKNQLLHLPYVKKEKFLKSFSVIQILGAFFIYVGLFRVFFFIIFICIGEFVEKAGVSRSESIAAFFFSMATIFAMLVYIKAMGKHRLRLVLYRSKKIPNYKIRKKIFFNTCKNFILFYPLFLFAAKVLNFIIICFFGKELPSQIILSQIKASLHDPITFFYLAANVIIAVPFLEELFFRGLIQVALIKWIGRFQGILWSSLIFTAMHFSPLQGASNLSLLPALFLTSLTLGIIYEKERTLLAPIIFHTLFNLVNLSISIL